MFNKTTRHIPQVSDLFLSPTTKLGKYFISFERWNQQTRYCSFLPHYEILKTQYAMIGGIILTSAVSYDIRAPLSKYSRREMWGGNIFRRREKAEQTGPARGVVGGVGAEVETDSEERQEMFQLSLSRQTRPVSAPVLVMKDFLLRKQL